VSFFSRKTKKRLIPECFYFTNTIFIHIPKTAGQSIGFALYGHTIHHDKAADLQARDPAFYKGAFKFAVVRDPIARFRSAYTYLQAGGRCHYDRKLAAKYLDGTLDDFIDRLADMDINQNRELFHFHTQSSFVAEAARRRPIVVDRVYNMDSLAVLSRDFSLNSRQPAINAEFPHRNASSSSGLELTERQKGRLRDIYDIDYINFF